MPRLIVENVPAETYSRLQEWAAAERRSVPDEALHLLSQVVQHAPSPAPRLPDFIPGDETSPPFDLPRSSQPVTMVAQWGQARLPDPIEERVSE